MAKWMQHVALVGALALAGSAQAQTQKNANTMNAPNVQGTDQVAAKWGVTIPSDPKAFAERLHESNQMEIMMGQLAQQKGTNPDVRNYGKMLEADHKNADDKLVAFAKQQGWTLSAPQPANDVEKAMMQGDQATMNVLKALNGQAFDDKFMATMVADHDLDLAKVTEGQRQFKMMDPLLKPVSQMMKEHRDRAYKILGQLKMQST